MNEYQKLLLQLSGIVQRGEATRGTEHEIAGLVEGEIDPYNERVRNSNGCSFVIPRYTTDLNAVERIRQEKLPDHQVVTFFQGDDLWGCYLLAPDYHIYARLRSPFTRELAHTHCLAYLAAVLRALAAKG